MPREAKGFLCEDGRFFEDQETAELYEAKEALWQRLEGLKKAPDRVFEMIDACGLELRRYLDALKATRTSEYHGDNGEGQEGTTPVLKQQVDRPEPVPDVGRSAYAEDIFNDRKGYGP